MQAGETGKKNEISTGAGRAVFAMNAGTIALRLGYLGLRQPVNRQAQNWQATYLSSPVPNQCWVWPNGVLASMGTPARSTTIYYPART